jgi:superfamily II DNA or RNA helicase
MSAAADSFANMRQVVLGGVDAAALADVLGPACFARGLAYYQQGAVGRVWWDASRSALAGTVRGRTGEFYTTAAFFTLADGLPPQFEDGRCSCPVGANCKHVVALILAGTGARPEASPDASDGPAPRQEIGADLLSWQRTLESLLTARPAEPARPLDEAPLAIELSLAPAGRPVLAGQGGGQPLRLLARLVQPGRSGAWVSGSLSWAKLATLHYEGGYRLAQVRLLQELYAVQHAASRSYFGYGSYGEEKAIELSAFESAQLWPMLDRARAAGIELVYARKLGAVPAPGTAVAELDVTQAGPAGPYRVTPVIRVDGAAAVPLAFIGSEGHGLVYADPQQVQRGGDYASWRFGLARLEPGVPRALQQLALATRPLEVPAAELERFRDDYYPRLRQAVTVTSSDGSFTPPRISAPTLVLQANYGQGHELEVSWAWAYQLGDRQVRTPLQADLADSYRDLPAERALLAGLDLPLGRFGLLCHDATGRGVEPSLAARARFDGVDTMLLSTELLPLLASHEGVDVEISGSPASYRAADDSLEISLSADEVPGDTDWFDLGVSVLAAGRLIPFTDLFVALSRGEPYLLLDDGAYISLLKPELQQLARLIEEARALQDAAGPAGSLRISRFQAGLWQELTEIGVVRHQAQAWQRQAEGLLTAGSVGPAPATPALQAQLRPYQQDGFAWLAFLWQHRLGGILADDMGLGKTLQSLALISHARQAEPGLAPFLIVAPTSVVSNWAAESARFTPDLTVVAISETSARRGESLHDLVAGADVVVTSYALLRIDYDCYAEISWAGLILDEAQFAKNHQSKIYQCARRLPVPFKLAITGTPMENNLMELWALLSITAPGLFPSPDRFREFYARPIEREGRTDLLATLRRRIKPLVLRRTKGHVAADLPAKQEQILEVVLHPRHRRIYATHLQRERQKVLGLISDMNANRFTILRSLTLMRQLSLHAGLVGEDDADVPSAKIEALLEHLRYVTEGGHRALVFSQFTGFLRLVAAELDAAGVPYCYLDGKTRDRAGVVREWSEGSAPVFLISLKAGGFGLNLTEADYVFLLDPWWNPATEAQAIDRTHRIGQTRNVMVYRLIAAGTIEEKVMALQQRKAELFASVIDSGNTFGGALTAEDIRGLFT